MNNIIKQWIREKKYEWWVEYDYIRKIKNKWLNQLNFI